MKTIEDAISDAMRETDRFATLFDIQKIVDHIKPFLAQPPDAAAMRKAEVARIAEALFIAECDPYPEGHFLRAETFVAYKESLK
jgi:hypothetical protein